MKIMLHKHMKEVDNRMSRKPSSGVRKAMRGLKEHVKKGEMPLAITANWGDPVIKAYEAIDRSYAMPSQEYLDKVGVGFGNSWIRVQDRTNSGLGEYERLVMATPKTINIYAEVPLGASDSAKNGAVKFSLYHMLRRSGDLNASEFVRHKKK